MAKIYFLPISPQEVVRLLRAEIVAEQGQPELYLGGRQFFIIEEDFDRDAYHLVDAKGYDLVREEAELIVEPRLEQDYWILSLLYGKNLGPQQTQKEDAFFGGELTLEEFVRRFLARGDGRIRVRLDVQTPEGRRHFDRWWAALEARHPATASCKQSTGAAAESAM